MRIRSVLQRSLLATLLAATAACVSPAAKATIILNNLGGTSTGNGLDVDIDTRIALGFTIQPAAAQNGTWTFTISSSTSSPGLLMGLFNDNGGKPNDASAVFSLTGGNTSPGVYTFSGNGTLNAGTYWLVASTTSQTEFYRWLDRGTYTENGATFFGSQFDISDGSGWQSITGHPLSVSIDVTPVPEPIESGAIGALFLIACSVAHSLRCRRTISKSGELWG